MAKSRSRSPRWKPRPPPYRSPDHNRHWHFQDYFQDKDGFHRDTRKPLHWEDERHAQNNSRKAPYNRSYDKSYEQNSFTSNLRKSPFEITNRLKRKYSPERRGDGNRRFPLKNPENVPYREHNRNFYNNRNQAGNAHNDVNPFKAASREDTFHRPYNREPDRDWYENESPWKQDHKDKYLPPPRRRAEEFVERSPFQKRFPEDRREHEQPPKRAKETERLNLRSPLRNSHWKDNHTLRPYHDKDWSKDTALRDPSPVVYQTHTGEFTKTEYDYSQRSPRYVQEELNLSENHTQRRNRHEERETVSARTSQHNRLSDRNSRERRKYTESALEPSTKYNARKCHDGDLLKNDIDNKQPNHRHKDWGRKEDVSEKEPTFSNHQRNQSPKSPGPKALSKISPEKNTIMVNLALKNPTDKYRKPDEHRNHSKDTQPKSEETHSQNNYEGKQRLRDDGNKRNTTSNERQVSQDLVAIGGNEAFRPVFEHLDASAVDGTKTATTEFTQEIITIIHQVKANHFKSAEISLHERFSKLVAKSNKQDLNLNTTTPQANPEIHRRIDISLEDLQNKSLHKTEVHPTIQRVIEDPNDLRHDIERRRKQRLHSEENGTTDIGLCPSNVPNHDAGDFLKSPNVSRPPFRQSTGRPRGRGSFYRGKSNQFFSSRGHFESS